VVQNEKSANGKNKIVPGEIEAEDKSLMIITVNEYQYKAFAKSAANQPISVFFQSPIEPIKSSGTDHMKSAIPNPYVVARFI